MTEEVTDTTAELTAYLNERFPGVAQPAEHEGLVIVRDRWIEVATHLRDELGYAYLSSVTGVDYPEPTSRYPARYEAVYHLFQPQGGPLTLHVHADRENPVIPSVVGVWPGAEFQEREAWDLVGIRFEGHPDLRRILTWEGFAGHPLRKDWREPYYEEEKKPFDSRWPDGRHVLAETRTTWGQNVRYPPGWVPGEGLPDPEGSLYELVEGGPGGNGRERLDTDHIVINMGPQHPSTHGVFRMAIQLDGETIQELKPVMGYLHRCHDKIGERNMWLANMPYTDRLDYVCSMSNNFPYALAVEQLLGVEVPERAEYIRVIMAEFTRIVNHFFAIGALFNEMGSYFTPFLYGFEEREFILDLFEMASGSRMMCNYFRFGGVARDLPEEFLPLARELVYDRLPRAIDTFDTYLTDNEIFHARARGVGVLPPEIAVAYSCTGPLLRGSGVPYDIRRAAPYSIYDEFDFDVVVEYDCDIYSRYLVRIGELRQSVRILQQALERIPAGPTMAGKLKHTLRVPAGESYGRVEAPKGELGFYVVSDGGANPYRYHVRSPSFINLTVLEELCKGHKIADVVVIFGSIDITMGEVDR